MSVLISMIRILYSFTCIVTTMLSLIYRGGAEPLSGLGIANRERVIDEFVVWGRDERQYQSPDVKLRGCK